MKISRVMFHVSELQQSSISQYYVRSVCIYSSIRY